MFKYAQIDVETGKCISVSFLSGEIDADNMVLLSAEDNVSPNDIYENGTWTPGPPTEPTEPQPDRIALLEAENADLKARIADIEMFVADMIGGA